MGKVLKFLFCGVLLIIGLVRVAERGEWAELLMVCVFVYWVLQLASLEKKVESMERLLAGMPGAEKIEEAFANFATKSAMKSLEEQLELQKELVDQRFEKQFDFIMRRS